MTREELDQALEMLYEPDFDDLGRTTTPVRYPLDVIGAAARERLAQLPEKCGTCDGTGWADKGELLAKVKAAHTGKRVAVAGAECPTCHGSGKVYPDKVLSLVLTALDSVDAYEWNRDLKQAIAVLDAFGELE